MNSFKRILLSVYFFLIVALISAVILQRYVWIADCIFFGAVYLILYRTRKYFNLTPVLFLMCGVLVLSHCFAVFGFFEMVIFGLEYDTYVHFYSGIFLGLASFQYLKKFKMDLLQLLFCAFFISLGFVLVNEIIEFAGYKIFGEGEGFFLFGAGDYSDLTDPYENLMKDFMCDFYGILIGLMVSFLIYKRKEKK